MRDAAATPAGEGPFAALPQVVVRPGEPARAALWRLVEAAKAGDPLAPVTVVARSPYARLTLRRDLGRRRGLVNVRFLSSASIAELLGSPRLAATGRVPLSAARRAEAIHAALMADPGSFAAVADQRSTEEVLGTTFADLRRLPDDTLDAIAGHGPRPAAVVRLYRSYRARTVDTYDEEDLTMAAAAAVDAGDALLDEVGPVIAYLPRRLSAGELALLTALAARGLASVVREATDIDSTVAVGTHLVSAPDPEDEARAALRRLLGRAGDGVPLHRMAIVYPVGDPYARLIPEVLDGSGVPWNGPSPARLADSVAGRVLVGLLDLVDENFARDAVAAWLASGPIRDDGGHVVPSARWDVLSRRAGVVSGTDQWRGRLIRYRTTLGRELAAAATDDDVPETHVARLERDVHHVTRLEAFIRELLDRTRPPSPLTWVRIGAWGRDLLLRYLGGEAQRGQWPERELDAARRVDAALAELMTLDDLGEPVTLVRFRAAVDAALAAPAAHAGRFGTGVFVGPLHAAVGGDFAWLAVLGGAEGTLPPRGREDPFLPDADRIATGLVTSVERRDDQRRDYASVLAATPESVLVFPRADPRAQQSRLPARWLLETAAAKTGRAVAAEELRALPSQPWLDVIESFEQGVRADAEPGSLPERDLRSLAEWRAAGRPIREHPLATGTLGRGYAAGTERASASFTTFDGNVRSHAASVPGSSRPVSATALQDWATCPFRYLLRHVLRVREVERPEESDTISPLDEGTLVHTILEAFVRETPPRSPDAVWDTDDRVRLQTVAARVCDDAEGRGITGRPLLWRFARRRIAQTTLRFLDIDASVRRDHDAVPAPDGLEAGFGGPGEAAAEAVLADGQTVRFRGRVDRIDQSVDGSTAFVYDYKTGRVGRPDLDVDPVVGGTLLQLPIYALAAAARTGARQVEAYYWYTRAASVDEALVGYAVDPVVQDRFSEVLATIVDGVSQGCFPAYPGVRDFDPRAQQETFANCYRCPYDRVCPLDRGSAWARKARDEALEPFLRLVEDEGEVSP